MTEYEVILIGIVVLELIALILNTFINPSKNKEIDTVKVVQHNTDAVKALTDKIDALTITNNDEHEYFYENINNIKTDVEVLKQKHESDVTLLKEKIKK